MAQQKSSSSRTRKSSTPKSSTSKSSSSKSSGATSGPAKSATKEEPASHQARRPGFFETLRYGWRPARKPSGANGAAKTETAETTATAEATTKAAETAKPAPLAKQKPPAPNLQERMEGLQGWMAEIERKQERMTRIGGIALIVAAVAAAAAIALGVIQQQDAASKDDIDELREQVNGLSGDLARQTESQLGDLNGKITSLETRLGSLEQQQKQQASTIATLQSQVNSSAAAPAAPVAPAPPAVEQP